MLSSQFCGLKVENACLNRKNSIVHWKFIFYGTKFTCFNEKSHSKNGTVHFSIEKLVYSSRFVRVILASAFWDRKMKWSGGRQAEKRFLFPVWRAQENSSKPGSLWQSWPRSNYGFVLLLARAPCAHAVGEVTEGGWFGGLLDHACDAAIIHSSLGNTHARSTPTKCSTPATF